MVFPSISGSFAMRIAAAAAAPHEIPHRMPSSRAMRRAISTDSSFVDLFYAIHHGDVEIIRDKAGADTLNFVRSWFNFLVV